MLNSRKGKLQTHLLSCSSNLKTKYFYLDEVVELQNAKSVSPLEKINTLIIFPASNFEYALFQPSIT